VLNLAWTIDFSDDAADQLRRLDKPVARRIRKYLFERVATAENPRVLATALQGGYWRFRVGDYRLICDIRDTTLVVMVLELGHRREVYR
jgi:mRNA interferase RelE/StbE